MAVWNVILEVVGLGVVGLCWVVDVLCGAFRGASGRVWLLVWVFYRLGMEMGVGGA